MGSSQCIMFSPNKLHSLADPLNTKIVGADVLISIYCCRYYIN